MPLQSRRNLVGKPADSGVPVPSRPSDESSATVLLVDDDPALADAVRDLLVAEGFEVVPANNGLHALAQLRAGVEPDVIVLDVTMPVMDGFEFRAAQLADAQLRTIPVIVTTASGFTLDTLQHQLRVDAVFAKPIVEVERFLETLAAICGRRDLASAEPA